jgi:hypothetical protein
MLTINPTEIKMAMRIERTLPKCFDSKKVTIGKRSTVSKTAKAKGMRIF